VLPEMIFLDICLSGEMDGLQVAARLRGIAGVEESLTVAITGSIPSPERDQDGWAHFRLLKPGAYWSAC
jgi:hypothetical protein